MAREAKKKKKAVKKKKAPVKKKKATKKPAKKKSKKKPVKKKKTAVKKKPVKKTARKKRAVKKPVKKSPETVDAEKAKMEAAKFYAPQGGDKKEIIEPERKETELPERYYDNRLTLMARDPYWCYAYWDISPDFMEEKANIAGEKGAYTLVLRVYDITDIKFNGVNAHKTMDIDVGGDANNWYINVWGAGRDYLADLGFKTETGGFVMIARSNAMSTPSDNVSKVAGEEWMELDEDFDEILRVSGRPEPGGTSDILNREIEMGSDVISSFSSAELVKPGGFFLKADTELVLYGATEKNAGLKVKGENIKLNSDGTFSLRFKLNDGMMEIPVEATSEDKKEKIVINFNVERKTG